MVGNMLPMPTRIGPKKQRKIFVAEWRETRGLTQKQLGERMEPPVSDMTVSRWERATRGLSARTLEGIANAFDIEPTDLYRHPDRPSADALLRGLPQSIQDQAIAIIETLRKTGTK